MGRVLRVTRKLTAGQLRRVESIRAELAPRFEPAAPLQLVLIDHSASRRAAVSASARAAVAGCEILAFDSLHDFDVSALRGAGAIAWLDAGGRDAAASRVVADAIRAVDPEPALRATVTAETPVALLEDLYRRGVELAPAEEMLQSFGDAVRAFATVRRHRLRAAYRAACAERIGRELSDEVARAAGYTVATSPVRPMDEVIREHARSALRASCGNRRAAAALLGISRSRLYRLVG